MHATSFDATHGPEQLALAVLASADPLQLLGGWAQAAPQGELAKVLHLVFARLVGGEKHAAMSAFASEIRLGERVAPLRLLLIPSVFAPEAWGTTFLEGLLRKSMREYRGKRMIELGVGSGWISLVPLMPTGKIGQPTCSASRAAPVRPCLLYTSPSPRDGLLSRMPSSA